MSIKIIDVIEEYPLQILNRQVESGEAAKVKEELMNRYRRCDICPYRIECKHVYDIREGCKHYDDCPLKSAFHMCKRGEYLECNNGYEEEDEYGSDEEDEEGDESI